MTSHIEKVVFADLVDMALRDQRAVREVPKDKDHWIAAENRRMKRLAARAKKTFPSLGDDFSILCRSFGSTFPLEVTFHIRGRVQFLVPRSLKLWELRLYPAQKALVSTDVQLRRVLADFIRSGAGQLVDVEMLKNADDRN